MKRDVLNDTRPPLVKLNEKCRQALLLKSVTQFHFCSVILTPATSPLPCLPALVPLICRTSHPRLLNLVKYNRKLLEKSVTFGWIEYCQQLPNLDLTRLNKTPYQWKSPILPLVHPCVFFILDIIFLSCSSITIVQISFVSTLFSATNHEQNCVFPAFRSIAEILLWPTNGTLPR